MFKARNIFHCCLNSLQETPNLLLKFCDCIFLKRRVLLSVDILKLNYIAFNFYAQNSVRYQFRPRIKHKSKTKESTNVHCRFKIYRRFHFSHSWLRFFLLNYSWQWMDRPTPFRISPKCLLLNLSFVCSENWPTFLEFGSNAQTLGKSWHLRIVKKEIIFCGEFCKKWWLKTIAK